MNKKIRFHKATRADHKTIFEWLDKPHVIEFWDNSPEHRADILLFMDGRKEPTPYAGGDCDFYYWIGSVGEEPFCMVMTSEFIKATCIKEGSHYLPYLSETGKSVGLDFMIGDERYLGKGLAAPTLEAFTKFFCEHVDPACDSFIIDPGEHNPRAKRVYEKAGFKVVGEYISKLGYFVGNKSFIMTKKCQLDP